MGALAVAIIRVLDWQSRKMERKAEQKQKAMIRAYRDKLKKSVETQRVL